MSDHAVLHVKGRVLVGPDDVRDELWVVGGRISYDRPAGARDIRTVEGWALPGLVDAHCHVGLGPHGPVDAGRGREAGADRPRGRHPADPRRGLPLRHPLDRRPRGPPEDHQGGPPHRPHPPLHPQLRPRDRARGPGRVRRPGGPPRRRLGQAGRRLDRPRRSATWPPAGRADAVEAAIAEAHRLGARVTAHCFAEDSLRDLVEAGIDCIEHATGLTEDTRSRSSPSAASRSSRPWSTSRPSRSSRRAARPSSRAGRPICGGCTSAATTPCAPPTTRASRSTSARTRAAPSPHGLVAAEVAELVDGRHPARGGAVGDDLGRADVARAARAGGGRAGRPRGLRGGPAGRRTGAGGAATGGAERAGRRLVDAMRSGLCAAASTVVFGQKVVRR